MTDIDFTTTPFDGPLPCGENLEYDPQFLALDDAVRGKPEVQYGDTITPAAPPDWKEVRPLALGLAARTHDLRVLVGLTRAQLALDGAPGLAAGLHALAVLLETQWDAVHPQLDADDDGDPTLRVNTLAVLVEPGGMLRQVRDMPLVEVRAVGVFSLRDIEASTDEAGGESARSAIAAAFDAAPVAQLAATHAALEAAVASVEAIEAVLAQHLAASMGLDLAPLAVLLQRAAQQVRPHLGVQAAPVAEEGAAASPAAPRQAGDIASRADVVEVLDRLCAWYARHEPSSPVPLLLQRARGLVDKNFTELLQELAPDGLGQLAQVSGVRSDS